MVAESDAYVALRSPRAEQTADAAATVGRFENASSTRSHSGRGDENPVASVPIEPDKTSSKVSLWELYRFATPRDKAMLAVACVCACINGVLYPCMALVFGHAITAFDPFDRHAVNRAAFEYLAIAVALAVTDYLLFAMFGSLSERQAKALREAVLHRLLHHDVAWFDTHSDAVLQLSSRITSDSIKIKNGMGPKLGDTIKYIGQCAGGFAIGYARCWDLALVMSCVAPVSVVSMSYLVQMIMGLAKTIQTLYAEAGAVAEETLASMRTVASLNGEQRAVERYDAKSRLVEDGTIAVFNRAGFVQGVFTSSSWLMYGIGLWYGGWKVYHSEVPPGTVFQAFFGIILGTWSLGLISPNLTAVVEAQGVAKGLFDLLDESSGIDASRGNGLCPEHVDTGDVVFQDVHFAYPRRPDAPVLRGLNVTIKAGETVAFVGASGGGKSTIVALLERFYDPQVGTITLDGHDLRALNVAWLRGQIGLVSQQPVLFAMSVFDNIAAGATTTPVTQADVEAAARLANAHDFIMALPQQYNTFVGENGTALSGGQKQRIAIARAIVRQPRVLVLDEATSALDNESERVVQEALNNVVESSQQRMATIVIAHRLSTIRAADKIVVMAAGHVAESGTHTELMGRDGGVYKTMVEMQAMEESESDAVEVWTPLEEVVEKERVSEKGRPSSTTASVSEEKEASADASSDGSPQVDNESNFTVWDAMKLSAPEAKYYAVGMAAAVVHGLSPPCSALLVSAVAAMLTETYGEFLVLGNRHALNQIAPSVRTYGIYYLLGACVVGGAHCLQVRCFRLMAAKLTRRLRHLHFQSMCRQDIAFFDDPAHSTGALTSDLAIQANKVASVSGDAQSKMLQAATTLLAAVAVACTSGNAVLTLIVVLILPFIVVGEVVRANYANGKMVVIDDLSKAGSEASQALNNIRTVMAFGLEQQMCGRYAVALEDPLVKGRKDTRFTGLAVGYSSFVLFATYALVFWYGGVLVDKHEITFRELIRTLMAIILSAQAVGFAASWVAESKHALAAGGVIFTVRDRPHAIDALREEDGRTLDTVQGRLELRNVSFRYPTRPEVSVLSNFNLTIEANETIGFCGTSGGGKSTTVALLERFYDPLDGQVLLDGHDLRELRVSWLRRQIGYVGQEPTLFVGTIAENIAYGLGYAPSRDEIERVARLANAHDFITKLPDGYTTQVGARGELLSGGQKQRIAIARAVLRNPRILILDEATSALDSASERVVQEALDSVVATQQCTTVVIAHRLSTLRGADRICVVDQGRVAELGSHEELLRRDGLYARLLNGGDVREELRA